MMTNATQLTLGVQLGAGLYALHKSDGFAALLAFAGAAITYVANTETDADKAARLAGEYRVGTALELQSEAEAGVAKLRKMLG